jgi:8-oxo-dGTP pyrophosphatase MutT (NUDIX family)
MNILTEIYRSDDVNFNGKIDPRDAVRAVILRGQNLLMVYSSKVGDYKFPGGGVNVGETHEHALAREVLEECGATLLGVDGEMGVIIEYDYYYCRVGDGFLSQTLDEYEHALGFQPVWINVREAIEANKSLLSLNKPPKWLRREIFALDYIKRTIIDVDGNTP